MNSFEKLIEIFGEFPGIGERQARRFAYFLLSKNQSYLEGFSHLITTFKKDITRCEMCLRFVNKTNNALYCVHCSDPLRDPTTLLIVAKDADIVAIERSGIYNGYYVVLGGLIPILEKEPKSKIRTEDVLRILDQRIKNGLKEVIFALSATQEGEHTRVFLESLLEKEKGNGLLVSELGRGLSTGTELEYADPETIKAALKNKK